jgi:hypothetical protein
VQYGNLAVPARRGPHLPVERVDRDADLACVRVDVVALEAVFQVGQQGRLVQIVETGHVLDPIAGQRVGQQETLRTQANAASGQASDARGEGRVR